MGGGRITTRAPAPSPAEFAAAAGEAAGPWSTLVSHLETIGSEVLPTWAGAADGWALRVRRAGRALVWLTPEEDALSAMVVLGHDATDAAGGVDLSPAGRAALDAAPRYPDGTWVRLRVEDAQGLADVRELIALKLPPTIRRRFLDLA